MTQFNIKDYFKKELVLDKGHVELIDGMVMEPMLKVINAARVSFNKQVNVLSEKDEKLIKFLIDHEHFSTLRHSYFTFRVKAPLCVFRQWWKYQIGSSWIENEEFTSNSIEIHDTSWNEESGRYVEFTPEFYIPTTIRIQSKDNKQGSEGKLESIETDRSQFFDGTIKITTEDPVKFFENSCMRQYANYTLLVSQGAAKEQCRMLLPQNLYSECIWTCSLQTILFFLHQRLKEDAQWEIRQYANSVHNLVKPLLIQNIVI